MILITLKKAFVRASTFTNAKGVTVNRKAHFTKRAPAKAKERHLRRTFTDHSDASAKKAHDVLNNQISTHHKNIEVAKKHLQTMSQGDYSKSNLSLQAKIKHLSQDIENQKTHIESLVRKKAMIDDRGAIWKDQLHARRAKSKVAASVGRTDHSDGQKKTLKLIHNHFINGKTKLQPGGIKVGKNHILVDTKHKDTGETKQIAIHKDGTIHDPKTINFQPVTPKKPVTVQGVEQPNKAETPNFPSFAKANEWLANQISEYGPKFLESEEYNRAVPIIDKLYEQSQKPKKKVVVKSKANITKPAELDKTDQEKTENRSKAMAGNKNAYKGSPKEEPKKVRAKTVEEVKSESKAGTKHYSIERYEPDPNQSKELLTKNRTYQKFRWKEVARLKDHTKEDALKVFNGSNFNENYRIKERFSDKVIGDSKSQLHKKEEPEKTEAEKTENRSKGMKGNKNAFNGGPKDEPKKVAAPKVEEQPKEFSKYEYALSKHTKNGTDLHLVKMKGRIDFAEEKAKVKQAGGWYDRYSKAFRFKTEAAAKAFIRVSAINAQTDIKKPKVIVKSETKKVWKPLSEKESEAKYPFGSKEKEVGHNAKDIAKIIRNDIKQGIKDGILPEGLKVSTTISGGVLNSSISLDIKEVPEGMGIVNPYQVSYQKQFPHSPNVGAGHPAFDRHTPEVKGIKQTLENIANQYNYNRSDLQSDYHDRNFYESIGVDYELKNKDYEKVSKEVGKGKYSEVTYHNEYGYTDTRPETIAREKVNKEKFEKIAAKRAEEGKKTVAVKSPKLEEPEESEFEKRKNRSDALKGNKNAYKGGPKEEPAKVFVKDYKTSAMAPTLSIKAKEAGILFSQSSDFDIVANAKIKVLGAEPSDHVKKVYEIHKEALKQGYSRNIYKMGSYGGVRVYEKNGEILTKEQGDKLIGEEKTDILSFKKAETDKVVLDLKESIAKFEKPEKSEEEKHQSRSDGMKGNRNAFKGGPEDDVDSLSKSITETKFKPIGSWVGEKTAPLSVKRRGQINAEVSSLIKKSPESYNASDIAKMRKYSGFGGVKAENERGVLYDYFTSPPVAQMTLQMLNKIGEVKPDSSILEPSVGTGVFFDVLPDTHKKTGVEIDARTAAVASAIHKDATIHSGSFEEFNLFNEEKFDHVVGNAPFGDRSVATSFLDMPDEKSLDKYFLERSLDSLKAGGTMSMIVHSGVLDGKKGEEWRLGMLKKGKFLGAVRLPDKSFSHTHTSVSPDILFFRKHDDDTVKRLSQLDKNGMKDVGAYHDGWVKGVYYKKNPNHKLGVDAVGNFGASIVKGNLSHSAMDEAVKNFTPEEYEIDAQKLSKGTWNMPKASVNGDTQPILKNEAEAVKNKTLNVGATKTINGVTYFLNANHRWQRMDGGDPETTKKINDIKEISAGVKAIREAMQTDRPVDNLQGHTRQLIQDYIDKHGSHPVDDKDIKKLLKKNSAVKDIHEALSTQLDSDILTKQNVFHKEIELKNGHSPAVEAMREMAKRMKSADEDTIRSFFPNKANDIMKELNNHKDIFLDHEGKYHLREYYLSGNAYDKMDALKKSIASEKDEKKKSKMQQSHDEVKKAIGWKSIEDSSFKPYNNWIPEDIVQSWIKKETISTQSRAYRPYDTWTDIEKEDGKWKVDDTSRLDIERYLNNQNQRGNTDTKDYNERMDDKFLKHVTGDDEIRNRMEELYNRNFNSELGSPKKTYAVKIDGWNDEIELQPHQWQTIHHLYENRKGISALGTGFGKTFSAIGLAAMLRQQGELKRGFFQVPDNKVMDWVNDFKKCMPGLKIGYLDPESSENKNQTKRHTHLQGLANGDYDMIILSDTTASTIQLNPKNEQAIDDRISNQMTSKKTKGKSARQSESIKMTAESKLDKTGKKNKTITFEDFGFDTIFADEMHHHKNLFSSSQSRALGVTGMSSKDSKRAMSFFKKSEHIRGNNDNKNVYGLTATPMSNSPLEFYNMLSHIAPEYLEQMGMTHIDDFIKEYGDIQDDFAYNWANGERKAAKVLKGFHRLDSLRDTFFKFTDYQTDASKLEGLNKPSATLKPSVLESDATQSAAMKDLKAKIEDYAKASSEDRKKLHPGENHLTYYMKMRAASLDLELADPQKYKGWKNPKVDKAAEHAWESYKNTGGGQVVFCDRVQSSDGSFNMHDKIKAEFIAKGFKPEDIVIVNGMTKGGGKMSDAKLAGKLSESIKNYNNGTHKVIIGTTATLGEGVNLQTNSAALHHIDVPFKPSDIIQRNGRIERQGNKQSSVVLHNYLSTGTIDNYSVNLVQNKANWIDKLLNSKSSVFLNGDDANFFDTEGLMLALTEELGSKSDAEAMRNKIKADKTERIKQDKSAKADKMFAQYSNIRESILKNTGPQDSSSYQSRVRKSGELSESLAKNPEFKYPNLLDKDSNYHYDKKSKTVYEKDDIIKHGKYYFRVTDIGHDNLKAEKIAGPKFKTGHHNINGKETESIRMKDGKVGTNEDGHMSDWEKASKVDGKYSEAKALELNSLYNAEDFQKQSVEFKEKNIAQFAGNNDLPVIYKNKDGELKTTGDSYLKPDKKELESAKQVLVPGRDDREIGEMIVSADLGNYELGTEGVKFYHTPKVKDHIKKITREKFDKDHGDFFSRHVGDKAVPFSELSQLKYGNDRSVRPYDRKYGIQKIVENSGGKYEIEDEYGKGLVRLAKSISQNNRILIRI